jgi:ribosomal-protein-alanine N-acetyltransferase
MTSQRIDLRFARRRDAPALARMSRDLIEGGLGWSYRPERVSDLVCDPEVVALVAHEGARVTGFAIMRFGDERAHLVLLAVDPAFRRRGIARRLVVWLLESAAVAGMSSVHVELRADNRPARALYRAAGFVESLRIPRYYRGRETALRMLRMLRAPTLTVPAWQPSFGRSS